MRPRSGWSVWAAGCFAGALVLGASPANSQVFRDDFEGSALDSTVWISDLGSGQVTVSGGVVTLTNSGTVFPVVTTRNDPFPPGDFRVRVGMQYHSQGFCGDGFGAIDNFWEDYWGVACRPFLLWQDGGGLYVYTGSAGSTPLAPPPETGYHVFEWLYQDGAYAFSMDGAVKARGGCAPRATGVFFGHPHPIGCPGRWTEFEIDFVEIVPVGATSSGRTTWGGLKQIYR